MDCNNQVSHSSIPPPPSATVPMTRTPPLRAVSLAPRPISTHRGFKMPVQSSTHSHLQPQPIVVHPADVNLRRQISASGPMIQHPVHGPPVNFLPHHAELQYFPVLQGGNNVLMGQTEQDTGKNPTSTTISGHKKGSSAGNQVTRAKSKKRSSVSPKSAPRKFTDDDMHEIFRYWEMNYASYGRMGARHFSRQLVEHLNRKWIPQTSQKIEVTREQVERKLKWVVEKYRSVVDKLAQSGFGNDENDPQSLEETKTRLFKYFHDVHPFLGSKSNNAPSFILQYNRRGGNTRQEMNRSYGERHSTGRSGQENGEAGDADGDIRRPARGKIVRDGSEDEADKVLPAARNGTISSKSGSEPRGEQRCRVSDPDFRNAGDGSDDDDAFEDETRGQTGLEGQQKRKDNSARTSGAEVLVDEAEEEIEPQRKRRKTNVDTGKKSISPPANASSTPSGSNSRTMSRKSKGRAEYAQRLRENAEGFAEHAQKALDKSVNVMENDGDLRKREVSAIERDADAKVREVNIKEKEVQIRQAEAQIAQIKAHENALREQAAMFKHWGDDEEAKKCIKEAREVASNLVEC